MLQKKSKEKNEYNIKRCNVCAICGVTACERGTSVIYSRLMLMLVEP